MTEIINENRNKRAQFRQPKWKTLILNKKMLFNFKLLPWARASKYLILLNIKCKATSKRRKNQSVKNLKSGSLSLLVLS